MSIVDLKLDEANELVFKIDITGSDPVNDTPKIRFMCESGGISYAFQGKYNSAGEVEVSVPAMQGKIKEGKYKSTLEVILENKIFFPLSVDVEFKKSVQVVAEIITKTERAPVLQEKTINASLVSKPSLSPKPRQKARKPKSTLRDKFGK